MEEMKPEHDFKGPMLRLADGIHHGCSPHCERCFSDAEQAIEDFEAWNQEASNPSDVPVLAPLDYLGGEATIRSTLLRPRLNPMVIKTHEEEWREMNADFVKWQESMRAPKPEYAPKLRAAMERTATGLGARIRRQVVNWLMPGLLDEIDALRRAHTQEKTVWSLEPVVVEKDDEPSFDTLYMGIFG